MNGKRDGELLRLYAEQRAEEAFTELGRRYARLIYATCLRETGDRTLAEDATQGVFLLLSQKAHALRRRDTVAGWLYAAARNVARNLLKQERRKQMNEARAMSASVPETAFNPLWERIDPHFHDALDRLKPADREAVLLRYVEEESLTEVGIRLGVSENTARMRINRALEKIRIHLAQAGIAVTAGLLVTLLEEHSAQAVPARALQSLPQIASRHSKQYPDAQLTRAAREAGIRMSWRSVLQALPGSVGVLLLLGGVTAYRHTLPQRLDRTEQRRLYATLTGTWQGTLEYADDRTGQRFTYPTLVTSTVTNTPDTFRFTATYEGSTAVDTTTLSRDVSTGAIAVENGGSHRLAAVGDLFRLRDGNCIFEGFSVAQNRNIRLTFSLKQNQLTIQEEYRRLSLSDYQFRNRFTLQRH